MNDTKFEIKDNRLVKKSNGEAIPDDEPTFILRGRDNLAIPLLKIYHQLCEVSGCTDYQLSMNDQTLGNFENFACDFPERMKQPGVTRGL
jgi:hypothetical protein